jgi:8-oxo-dGTP pyrophosphatase MutT (NUDIX family)
MTPDPDHNPWTTLSSREVYSNPWIRVREDQVLKPTGTPGIYGVVEYLNRAVGVVPIDDHNHTWLVGQFRYTQNRYEWEIPEGGCPQGESLENCARRELLEETGLVAGHLEPLLLDLQLSNSVSNETAHLFIARQLTQAAPQPEDTEQLAIRRLPLPEAIAMAASGEIRDAMSVIALLALAHHSLSFNEKSHLNPDVDLTSHAFRLPSPPFPP